LTKARSLVNGPIALRATYDVYDYEKEKRHAFEALAALVERIVHPPSGNVVPIREASNAS
jgi:hypothetical protein